MRSFLAGWAIDFLTDHCSCCSFKEEIHAYCHDLSMGRCCNYSVPSVSGAAQLLSALSLPPDVVPDPQQLKGEENVIAEACSDSGCHKDLLAVSCLALGGGVKNYIRKFTCKSCFSGSGSDFYTLKCLLFHRDSFKLQLYYFLK